MSGDLYPIAVVAGGIALLLILILRFKMSAFLTLLLVSIGVGLAVGMEPAALIETVKTGMGGTLGFVAVVVGLGALFGTLLEISGGVQNLSHAMIQRFGMAGAPWALGAVGFLVAIPVFFDVALIILAPILYGLTRDSKYTIVYWALPLIAGLGCTHAFIPPTPGPIAVAELIHADMGWVIMMGAIAGLPAMAVAGPLYARLAWRRPPTQAQIAFLDEVMDPRPVTNPVGAGPALFAILIPILLIVMGTVSNTVLSEGPVRTALAFIGHPFVALIIAVLYVYVFFGVMRGETGSVLRDALSKALEPAGVVILVTGAGGVLKQVLIDSGVGNILAAAVQRAEVTPIVFSFLVALLVRVAQGSATVAMITAAGLAGPILDQAALSAPHKALVVIAIAAGATAVSHVNDSGFWLVSRYLGLNEAETIRSWTVASTLIGVVGFLMALILATMV